MADGPKHKRFNGFCNGIPKLLLVSFVRTRNIHGNISFSQNNIPVKTTSHAEKPQLCTLYESIGNPGHSSRGLRNHISFAMQIVVRNSHLKSSGPNRGHRGVCVAMGPHGGPLGPHGGPGPSPGPRQPDSLVSGPFWLPDDAKS